MNCCSKHSRNIAPNLLSEANITRTQDSDPFTKIGIVLGICATLIYVSLQIRGPKGFGSDFFTPKNTVPTQSLHPESTIKIR